MNKKKRKDRKGQERVNRRNDRKKNNKITIEFLQMDKQMDKGWTENERLSHAETEEAGNEEGN